MLLMWLNIFVLVFDITSENLCVNILISKPNPLNLQYS